MKSDTIVADFDDSPSGLGWLPDGSLLVVAMESGRLLKVDASGAISEHADCSGLARGSLNDMIVRGDGTAYVGDMGARIFDEHPDHSVPGQTLMVTPQGEPSCAADDLGAPNGHILTPDEKTLYVGESARGRITAFDVADDGTLSNMRTFAEIPPAEGQRISPPDGICLDSEGAIWSADPVAKRLVRVRQGGDDRADRRVRRRRRRGRRAGRLRPQDAARVRHRRLAPRGCDDPASGEDRRRSCGRARSRQALGVWRSAARPA